MLFNSFSFVVFFPTVVALYFLAPVKYRSAFLLFASSVFYMAFIPYYILILFVTIGIDYYAGIKIEDTDGPRRKTYLVLSIIATALVLVIFKYFNFFNANFAAIAEFFHWNYPIGFLSIVLPIGLSFHTFQSLSYVIEVYRKKQKAERHFGVYALYVMFFPQLVAGPIERPQNLLHQFYEKHDADYARIRLGLQRMLFGFFKKMVIADNLATYVNLVYGQPWQYGNSAIFLAVIFFALQIYCDFSGYSDIAIGSAKVMGFTLMENFTAPYGATTVTEFWRKWHISLSGWIRDYIFFPIAARFRSAGKYGIVFALLSAFAFAGLWHGASWLFVLFGLIHGLILSVEFLTSRFRNAISSRIPAFLLNTFGRAYVFFFWSFSLVFFRASSFSDARFIVSRLFSGVGEYATAFYLAMSRMNAEPLVSLFGDLRLYYSPLRFSFLLGVAFLVFIFEILEYRIGLMALLNKSYQWVRWTFYIVAVLSIMNLGVTAEVPFIYFQF
jgi:D-alanyl-lipoteichoic acid acyltransferase DltB (MBOAT superfamily)